jgi:PAS domain S-box-containing protein
MQTGASPEHRRLELSRAFNQLSETVLRGDCHSGILQSLLEIAGPALEVDRVLLFDVRLSSQVALRLCEWRHPARTLASTDGDYPLHLFSTAARELERSGGPLESSHSAVHPLLVEDGADKLLHEEMSLRRLLWYPFLKRSDGFHLLVFHQLTEDRPWSVEERQFIEAVAAQISLAIMKLGLLRERERAHAEQRRSESRLQLLYDHTPTMFFTVDPAGKVRSVNRFAIEYLGYPATELLDESVLRVVHPDDQPQVLRHLAACFADPGQVHVISFRKVRRDGMTIWVREAARALEGPDGANAFIVCEDVTESRAHEEAAREAESKAHGKDEFMAMLGHELRNPLAPIVTALEIMHGRGFAEPELEVITRQVWHLRRLVDDLLDVSRITRGKVELHVERVELAQVAAQAVEIARPLVESKRQTLRVAIASRGLPVDGDPARLVQAFSNLLTNAAKYSDDEKEISFSAERVGDRIQVRVVDQGEGIESDMLERIFGLFVQREQPTDRARSGLGLGLTIVRNLVELHGGTVQAHSAGRGQGTTLLVDLPAAIGDPPIASRSGDRASDRALRAGSAARILVVDDNEDARELLCQGLSAMGYRVYGAADGPAALAVADAVKPTTALVDIGLPGMDGYELGRRLRQTYGDALRLVALTGYGQASDRERSRAAGFAAHLVKPIGLDALERILRGAVPAELDASV